MFCRKEGEQEKVNFFERGEGNVLYYGVPLETLVRTEGTFQKPYRKTCKIFFFLISLVKFNVPT